MQDLNKRIEMVKAKELLGIPLENAHLKEENQMHSTKTECISTNSQVLAEVNITLLRANKNLETKLEALEKKLEIANNKLGLQRQKAEDKLEAAKNEKATNLQIRKIVDRLPGAHYQLSEKVSILNSLIDLAGVIYKGRYGLEVDDDRDIPVKGCEGHYNLGKVVETVESLIRKF